MRHITNITVGFVIKDNHITNHENHQPKKFKISDQLPMQYLRSFMGPEPSENYSMVLIPVQDHGCKLGSYQAVTTTATTKKINLRVENER